MIDVNDNDDGDDKMITMQTTHAFHATAAWCKAIDTYHAAHTHSVVHSNASYVHTKAMQAL